MITTHCPKCDALNEIPEAYLGREVTCPACKGDYVAESPQEGLPKRIPITAPLIPPPAKQEMQDTKQSTFNPTTILLGIILILFIYVNRSAIFPASKEPGDVDMPPAMDVRPVVQIWEYRTKRYYNSGQFDADEDVSMYGEGAKEQASVIIDDTELNGIGGDGWELVSTYLEMETAFYNFGKSDLHTGIKENVRPQSVVAIFKRPKR